MSRGWGGVLVGALAVGLVMANGASADEEARPVADTVPAPVEPPGITAYADDPARGAQLCDELVRQYPGMDCHIEPSANSPHGTPWWLGNDGTSWSVG